MRRRGKDGVEAAPDVTVIIPSTRPRTLAGAINSALSQGEVDVEVVVADDSPGQSQLPEVIESIGDPRVVYLRRPKPSGGVPAAARNEALERARGRFVHFLDDDDELAEGALASLSGALDRRPDRGVAVGLVEPFGDPADDLSAERAFFADSAATVRGATSSLALAASVLFDKAPLNSGCCMVRRECAVELGGYSVDVPRCEGLDFYGRAIRKYGFVFVDSPVIRYRIDSTSLMHGMHGADAERLLEESYRAIHRHYRERFGTLEFMALKAYAAGRRIMRRSPVARA